MEDLQDYASRGARALVLLHDAHLRECLAVWRWAKAAGLQLPATDHDAYESLEHLLAHILNSARHYMVSICRLLELPDPKISSVPEISVIESEADTYLEHLLVRWRLPLADVPDVRLEPPEEEYFHGMPYWTDAMLEHAVMHPIRHGFQLRALLEKQATR